MTNNNERRIERRIIYAMNIEFFPIERDEPDSEGRWIQAVTVNLSRSGLCVYTRTPIVEGEKLRIKESDLLLNNKEVSAKWVRKINNELFKTGLKIVKEGNADMHGFPHA